MNATGVLRDHQSVVERVLRDAVDEQAREQLPLYRMMQYQLGWVASDGTPDTYPTPDRVLGAACIEAAGGQGGSPQVAAAAAACELLYNSVLVHEQMQTAEGPGEERAAVWWLWGPAQAINVGDGLHALARIVALGMQDAGLPPGDTLAALSRLDTAALRCYEGQYLDLTFQERIDVMQSQYERMAVAKRGALLGGAMAIGASLGGRDDASVEALRTCGEQLGLASAIAEDISDLAAEPARPRVLNKAKLFPVVVALEKATISQKRALGDVYFKRVVEPGDLPQLRAVLDEAGALALSREHAAAIARNALDGLRQAGMDPASVARWESVVVEMVA